jgi:peptide/nickel transport system substrate-binding protein
MVKKITRRNFLFTAAASAASVALAACGATPTAEPEAEEPTPEPEPTNTTAPAVEETPKPTGTPVPTMAPETRYNEAPMLAQMVEAGDLPPVDERLPATPLVLSPLHGIGQYGGKIRSFGSEWGGQWEESQYGHSPLRWIDDGLGIVPGMIESYESNDDASVWTLYFRKGLKWSDGEPCTVDDVLYWWNDLVLNEEHTDAPPDFGSAGGELAEFNKLDDYTLEIAYVAPSPLTEARLAMWVNSAIGPRWIAPEHYLKQFHPDYSDATDFEDHDEKMLWRENSDCPSLSFWLPVEFEPGIRRVNRRNPYYYAVDTEGNQLPYIDELEETVVPEKETQVLTITNGEIDFAGHIHHQARLGDMSVLLENADAGNYHVEEWDCGGGTGVCWFFNNDNPDDATRELIRTPEFKQAISHCVDRDTIQQLFYFGRGEKSTGTHSPKCREFTFSEEGQELYREHRDAYVEFDIELAQSILDDIGMVDANGDGWRDRPDGEEFVLRVDYPSDTQQRDVDILELVVPSWEEAGLRVQLNPMAPGDFDSMWQAGQGFFRYPWGVGDGPNHLVYPSWLVPNEPARWAPLSGRRLQYLGTEREDSELDVNPWDREPPRFASSERDLIGDAVWQLQEIYQEAIVTVDEIERHKLVWDMLRIHIDMGPFFIGTVANETYPIIISNDLINVPAREELALNGFICPWIIPNPALTNPETYAYKNPEDHV